MIIVDDIKQKDPAPTLDNTPYFMIGLLQDEDGNSNFNVENARTPSEALTVFILLGVPGFPIYGGIMGAPGVYKIENIFNGKIYIGSSVDIERRWKQHINDLRKDKHHSIYLQRSFNKYGEDAFKFSVIEFVENPKNLIEREQYYIDLLHPTYNILPTAGSNLGMHWDEEMKRKISKTLMGNIPWNKGIKIGPFSDETRKKMSESRKGHFVSVETRKKLSKTSKGKPSPMRGKHHTLETRKKISETLKGHKGWMKGKHHTLEARKKMSEACKNPSLETRKKISEAKKGQIPWNKGKTGVYSKEALRKMSEARKKYYAQKRQEALK